jgi:hypothetical protein
MVHVTDEQCCAPESCRCDRPSTSMYFFGSMFRCHSQYFFQSLLHNVSSFESKSAAKSVCNDTAPVYILVRITTTNLVPLTIIIQYDEPSYITTL